MGEAKTNRAFLKNVAALTRLRRLVEIQARDDGLWFRAERATEAYLQNELRHLHDAVEAVFEKAENPIDTK